MRFRPPPLAVLTALTLAAGCTELPPLEQSVDAQGEAAPYPDLVPTAWLTDDLPETRLEEADAAELQADGDALRRKAARLRSHPSG